MSHLDHILMMKFLNRNYPVKRVKINGKFKRTIIIEYNQYYQLSDKNSFKLLYSKLYDILKLIFDTEDSQIKYALNEFLNVKKLQLC